MTAGSKSNVENFGGNFGIFKKHFIEITHPVEENCLFMLRLNFQILLEHWGDFKIGRHTVIVYGLRESERFFDLMKVQNIPCSKMRCCKIWHHQCEP